jgi:sulfur carrier protein
LTVTAAIKSASEAAAPEIAIEVNAELQRVRAGTLADVLVALGYGGQKVATALNGAFVPERMRTETPVASGDRIEILSARQGG